jgi:DNA-binding response OmpR family regulator
LFLEIMLRPAQIPPSPMGEVPQRFDAHSEARRMCVLVVDDEHLITDTICAILNEHGFDAVAAYSGTEAVETARTLRPDVVLSDVLMPKMSGVELGIQLRKEFPEMKIFLFSGQAATSEMIHRAQEDGHRFELFPKPIHPDELMARLKGLY